MTLDLVRRLHDLPGHPSAKKTLSSLFPLPATPSASTLREARTAKDPARISSLLDNAHPKVLFALAKNPHLTSEHAEELAPWALENLDYSAGSVLTRLPAERLLDYLEKGAVTSHFDAYDFEMWFGNSLKGRSLSDLTSLVTRALPTVSDIHYSLADLDLPDDHIDALVPLLPPPGAVHLLGSRSSLDSAHLDLLLSLAAQITNDQDLDDALPVELKASAEDLRPLLSMRTPLRNTALTSLSEKDLTPLIPSLTTAEVALVSGYTTLTSSLALTLARRLSSLPTTDVFDAGYALLRSCQNLRLSRRLHEILLLIQTAIRPAGHNIWDSYCVSEWLQKDFLDPAFLEGATKEEIHSLHHTYASLHHKDSPLPRLLEAALPLTPGITLLWTTLPASTPYYLLVGEYIRSTLVAGLSSPQEWELALALAPEFDGTLPELVHSAQALSS